MDTGQILDTPQLEPKVQMRYAGFWVRVVAYLIDFVVVFIGTVMLGFVLNAVFGSNGLIAGFAFYLILPLYLVIMESSESQTTLGKAVMGIYVGDENGNRISLSRATGRVLAKFLSHMFLSLGFIMAGLSSKKQALHDKIAGTYVYYK